MGMLLLFFAVGAAGAAEKGILVVDRFSEGADENGLPKGWLLEKTPGPHSKVVVTQAKDFPFVKLQSAADAFGIKKEISFDIRKFPYLSWQWKADALPPKGDIRKRETDDQAGQIYVVFPKFPTTINSRSVGYIWDTHAPVNSMGTSTAYGKMKYVVLQSGADRLRQWIVETRNVLEDYKKLFQEEPPAVGTVLLYINTQHTNSSAECSYADIFFSSSPPKGKTKEETEPSKGEKK